MPLAPVFAAAPGSAPFTRPARLFVAGAEVLLKAGAAGNDYGCPVDSIEVNEAGVGGVSSMTFTIEDPKSELAIFEDDPVFYEDVTNDRPIFRGFILSWQVVPFAGTGRAFNVTATGVEALLDWLIVNPTTYPQGAGLIAAIQDAAGNAQGVGVPLRAFTNGSLLGTQARPIGIHGLDLGLNATQLRYAVTLGRVSLREAIRQLSAAGPNTAFVSGDLGQLTLYGQATVDFYFGLRFHDATQPADDFATLTVPSGSLIPENLEHSFDGTARVRQVIVTGGNAAGSGTITDGSGLPGQVGAISDPTSLTNDQRDRIGKAYMAEHSLSGRGSFDLPGNTIATNVRAGSTLSLTDSQTGATGTYLIFGIRKAMRPGGRQDWTVTYGGLPESFAAAVRRLTRGTLQ